MRLSSRLTPRFWIFIPVCAVGLLIWLTYLRVQRVDAVTHLGAEDMRIDANSPTGYAGGKRWLIVPEHINASYQWISQTQQMLAKHEWRVRRVDDENAPIGREVHSASPYRWWLGFVAWCNHGLSGRPLGLSVERAAVWADPVLHLLLLVGTTIFVARQFGIFPAAIVTIGLSTMFPLAAVFLPGAPDAYGLMQACVLWSVLPLLAGLNVLVRPVTQQKIPSTSAPPAQRSHRWFLLGGIIGGIGLWISATHQVPVLIGIAVGGLLVAWVRRTSVTAESGELSDPTPWRLWALGGATTSLLTYLIEYYPAYLDLRLQVNHPLYGLAWLGVGEFLTRIETVFRHKRGSRWLRSNVLAIVLAASAVAALPVILKINGGQSFLAADPLASRLSAQSDGAVAKNFATWIVRDGLTWSLAATCLPLLLLGPAVWLLFSRTTIRPQRIAIALSLGPVLITLVLAFAQLRWWTTFDSTLLALTIVAATGLHAAANSVRSRRHWIAIIASVAAIGLVQMVFSTKSRDSSELTRLEAVSLIERSLAHWIADHAGGDGAVVLAPPDLTPSLCFHGGIRGLGTPNWENRDGVAATAQIVSATTTDEAQALLGQRGVTHIVLPSWDSDLDEFVRWTLGKPEDSFLHALHKWSTPPWIRPLAYPSPAIRGLEGQSVTVLQVTDDADRATSLSRLAEYFLEMQQLDLAIDAGVALLPYPSNLGALVARAQVEKARGDDAAFAGVFKILLPNLAGGLDRALPWDRRVSLAVVLALGERTDLARTQVQRCLTELNEERLRSLTPTSLYRLHVLTKTFALKFPDQKLADLARELLPAELRSRL